MENSIEIKIYRDGRYDTVANLKLKARNLIRKRGAMVAQSVDYFFTEYGR